MLAKGGRAVTSLATFLLLTRALGVRDYGFYAGVLAFTNALLPLASFGAGHLVMQRVSRDRDTLRQAWGDALLASAGGTALATALLATVGTLVIPGLPLRVILSLALSELIFVGLGEVVSYAYAAQGRFGMSAGIINAYGAARFLAIAVLYLTTPDLDLALVATAVLTVAAVHGATVALMLTLKARPRFNVRRGLRSMRSSGSFMISLASDSLQSDVDKTMLVAAGLPAAAGVYTAGYRVVSYSLLPVRSLIQATYPRFFVRGGAGGIHETWSYAKQISRPMLLYGVVAVGGLVLFAGPIATVIGEGFDEVATVIRIMAPLLVLQSVRTTISNALTGADFQNHRTVIFVVAALFNIALNLVLIPRFSWYGAVYATYATEALLVGATLGVIRSKRRAVGPYRPGSAEPTSGHP